MPNCQKCKKPLKESYQEEGEVYGKNYGIILCWKCFQKDPRKKAIIRRTWWLIIANLVGIVVIGFLVLVLKYRI